MPQSNFIAGPDHVSQSLDLDRDKPQQALFSIDETRSHLGGIGHTKIYDLIAKGELVAVKLGARTFITRDSRDALVASLPRADIGTGQHSAVSEQRLVQPEKGAPGDTGRHERLPNPPQHRRRGCKAATPHPIRSAPMRGTGAAG
jgi:hypothetical protein